MEENLIPKRVFNYGSQGKLRGCCEYDSKPSGSIKMGNFLTGQATVSFSRRTLLHGVCKENEMLEYQ
jgi:hypothetical protein